MEAEARGDSLTLEQVRDATKTAVELAGNANARISCLRREKVCQDLNKALIPLAKEDENFDEAPPSLFGTEFAKKAKDHVDQVKALRSTSSKTERPFFRGGPPSRGGGLQLQEQRWERWRRPQFTRAREVQATAGATTGATTLGEEEASTREDKGTRNQTQAQSNRQFMSNKIMFPPVP